MAFAAQKNQASHFGDEITLHDSSGWHHPEGMK
jgi:hypothetical protein